METANGITVTYTYDAWGKDTGHTNSQTADVNPLRYRGYVYDFETELYYLQSRYYNPETGRFINGDAFTATGQGLLGNNMFTYCLNNSVNYIDINGENAATLQLWISSMWTLCFADAFLPFGEIIYIAGIIILACQIPAHSQVQAVEVYKKSSCADSLFSNARKNTETSKKKPVNLPSFKKMRIDMEHVGSGHLPGGNRNRTGKKTVFWGCSMDQIYRIIQEAYENSKKLRTVGKKILIEGYSQT